MKRPARELTRLWLIVVFAGAMAWVESASVYYLRAMVDRLEPYQQNPLPMRGVLGPVEVVREVATLVMLLTVGMLAGSPARQPRGGALAGRTRQTRLAYTAIAFGVWDILYYVFLRIICDWPKSLLDWDVLFLLPLPWWGPILAPICIASLMNVWGTLATQCADESPTTSLTWKLWALSALGIALALYIFMSDSIRAVYQGLDVRQVLPTSFNWPAFGAALMLMSAPLVQMFWRWTMLPPTTVSTERTCLIWTSGTEK